jgi:saccharopine dehydrogenase (NADP+, L-glutamate forming)
MKNLLVLGAGRSAGSLISYLLDQARANNWQVTVADQSEQLAREKTFLHPCAKAAVFSLENDQTSEELISQNDVVVSLLPPPLHYVVAKKCLKHKKHLLTASYVSEEIAGLDTEAKKAGTVIIMEAGLDPGIDHMSALKEVESIQAKGGKIKSFKSYTGGLISPQYDTNPWHYKFTWNPKNVMLAGQGTVKYLEKGMYKYIPYHQLFQRVENIDVPGMGTFEGYANRDSLKYRDLYKLSSAETFIRGTLRIPPFCSAWNIFVQLGLTNDTYTIENAGKLTWREFINSYLPEIPGKTLKELIADYIKIPVTSESLRLLEWTGILEDKPMPAGTYTPAELLLLLLEQKWKLQPGDKDMIVMQHEFNYVQGSVFKTLRSYLVVEGDDKHTAMAKTVGLPLGIATKLVATGKIKASGVQIPVTKEFYLPILGELESCGIKFEQAIS